MEPRPAHSAACVLVVVAAAFAWTCRAPSGDAAVIPSEAAPPPDAPYVVVLGVAQDGGYPQIACDAPLCAAARLDPRRARHVASLLVVDPREGGGRWLIDATPDLAAQVELARGYGGPARGAPGRPPLFDGVFLTHAHVGHYLGLWQLGREAYGSAPTPVHGTARMTAFLRGNGPWSLAVEAGHIVPTALVPGEPVRLRPDLSIVAVEVPHRAEFTDTVAYVVEGPSRSVLHLPDVDRWEGMATPIEALVAAVDVAYLDATFFDPGELPGRDLSRVPHPLVVDSLARFAPLPAAERAKIRFLHLNHSNPLLDPSSDASGRVWAAGHRVARQGEVVRL